MSLDGKITTGDTDELDVDIDFPRISGIKEGLHQYYELEKQTDLYSLNTGRVMAKIGVNTRMNEPDKIGCSFIIIDSKPHLTYKGTEYMAKWVKKLYLATANKKHPAYTLQKSRNNIEIIPFEKSVHLEKLLIALKSRYGIERLTIQSGGKINSSWIRQGLIDFISIVVAPCLIGGSDTQSLMGGTSLHTQKDLALIRTLELVSNTTLKNSYIHLLYKVHPETRVEENREKYIKR